MEGLAVVPPALDSPRPLFRRIPIAFVLAAALSASAADVDPQKQNNEFTPKPSQQKRVEKKTADLGKTRPAANEKAGVASLPAAKAKAAQPVVIEKKTVPVAMTPNRVTTEKPGPAQITTNAKPPEKFEKKYQSIVAERFQAGISDAGQIKTAKLKPEKNVAEPVRINRFVYRRNEPTPVATPAGGENKPTAETQATESSAGS